MTEKAWALQIVDAHGEKQLLIYACFYDWLPSRGGDTGGVRLFNTHAAAKNAIGSSPYPDAKVVRVQVGVKVI